MATEIKAIQCPKCGSTAKTDLGLDHFRCESCGTEYFLDDGNIRTGPKPGIVDPQRPVASTRRMSPVTMFFFIILIGVLAICLIYIGSSSSSSSYASSTGAVSSPKALTWQYTDSYVYVQADSRPVIVGLGTQSKYKSDGSESEEPYIFFFDALTNRMLKSHPMTTPDDVYSNVYRMQQFSNGELYITANETALYLVDKASMTIRDVTQTFGAGMAELASGIAGVQIIYSGDEDAFKVVTNNGRHYTYFPIIKKVYTDQQLWAAEKGFKTLLPGAVEATGFQFSNKRQFHDEDTIQLVKYRFMDNRGGPRDLPTFMWLDYWRPAPIFVDKDDYRVLSYTNFTPGRIYFGPKVLYHDSDYVLISYAITAAGSVRYVQCLNARTAAIVFTVRLDDSNLEDGTVRFRDGFVMRYSSVYIVDMKGKLTTIKTDNHGL